MCLNRVDKVLDSPDETERQGWKVFCDRRGNACLPFYGHQQITFDSWMAVDPLPGFARLPCDLNSLYTAGFHVFMTRKACEAFIRNCNLWSALVLHVRYRGLHTIGIQDGYKCVVCREIFVPKPETKEQAT